MSENDSHLNGDETVSKEQYNEIVEKLADATQSKANLIEEIKDLREKKQITEQEAAQLKTKLEARETKTEDTTELTPETISNLAAQTVRQLLSERDSEEAKLNRDAAFAEFLSKNKEFHPENDEGGIKLSALERKLSRFNTGDLKTRADFMSVFEDAANLVVKNQTIHSDSPNPNPLPPEGGGSSGSPKEADSTVLNSKEMRIIESTFGGDKDRYLKIKAKRPDYVASLLQYLV